MIEKQILSKFISACTLSVATLTGLAHGSDGQMLAGARGVFPVVNGAEISANFSTVSPEQKTIHVLVSRSLFVNAVQKLSRIYITDPSVISAYAATPNQVLVTAKAPGVSSLVVWDQSGESKSFIVSSDLDISNLESSIRETMPAEDIHVASDAGRVMLSGVVGTSATSDEAAKLASLYSKDIFNALVVNSSRLHQVKLKVRVLEVDRSKLTQLGVNIFSGAGNTLAQSSTLQFPSQLTSGPSSASGTQTTVGDKVLSFSNPLNFLLYNSSINVGATLQDLEQKQVLQILAEPTLTTLNGEKASFLSGGEFPFPVVQGLSGGVTSISIQFRPYGVKLDFTPQVNIDGTIELDVTPEVSALDYTNAVSIDGYEIPALSTRKADTKVVLKSGQSFAISGLLDRRTTDQFSRTPGIASIPILGDLFKSKSIDHTRTDLIVVVTPEIVDPLKETAPAAEPSMPIPSLNPNVFDQSLPETKVSK